MKLDNLVRCLSTVFFCFCIMTSCAETFSGPDNSVMDLMVAYTGHVATNAVSFDDVNDFAPNLSFALGFFTGKQCLLNVGIDEKNRVELDKLLLRYEVTNEGLVLFEKSVRKPLITITALQISHNMDPEIDLALYLGTVIKAKWNASLGPVWDKYSIVANWPTSITLSMVNTDTVDSGE